jgi:hypothetical protein
MANVNKPAQPWLAQDAVAVPGMQHDLPKHPERLLPKFDPDKREPPEDHINTFILVIRLI